ncbi:uncharacterized protein LOC124594259 [Schistocerca americana]|uniref:uncharacterized protein LOC124594259 n=1 Tax=Schistocerca americana TaxID=7009 RepID=UPI001F4FFEF3|nr:uncharacterized protein LOC124594259 [Schistocerca americana]
MASGDFISTFMHGARMDMARNLKKIHRIEFLNELGCYICCKKKYVHIYNSNKALHLFSHIIITNLPHFEQINCVEFIKIICKYHKNGCESYFTSSSDGRHYFCLINAYVFGRNPRVAIWLQHIVVKLCPALSDNLQAQETHAAGAGQGHCLTQTALKKEEEQEAQPPFDAVGVQCRC